MLGGKAHGVTRPSALGTLVNAATYGMAIPTIHGMARSGLLAIWAANLRQGGSGKKAKKKGITTYIENVDFLVGANPIEFIGQIWTNNTGRYTMNLVKLRVAPTPAPSGTGSYTIADPNFYAVIGVTGEVNLSGTFNDYGSNGYGSGGIGQFYIGAGGSGYAVNDTFTVQTPTGGIAALGHVTAIGGGLATAVVLDYVGVGYFAGNWTTTATSGVGSGMILTVSSVGSTPYGGVTEFPLWNVVQHGPDLTNGAGSRWYPFCYEWAPADGATIYFPCSPQLAAPIGMGWTGGNGYVNIYYFQLNQTTKHNPPVTYQRLAFEQQLGSGSEYANAGLSSQQIIYPFYAGVGSSDVDLGASGMLPDFRVEVKGSNALYGTGDADFADMIEDTIRSGQMQTLSQLGLIQRGVNCLELPNAVQKNQWQALEAGDSPIAMQFFQPIPSGALILAMGLARNGASPVALSDSPGATTWHTIFQSTLNTMGVFWGKAAAAIAARNKVHWTFNGGLQYNNEAYLLVMDPSSDTIQASAGSSGTTSGVTNTISQSIITTGPAFLVAFFNNYPPIAQVIKPPLHWKDMFPNPPGGNYPNSLENAGLTAGKVFYRNVKAAGTYTINIPLNIISTGWDLVLVAISQSQPSVWPVGLGNILDATTLQNMRDQCRANGLIGSISMNSQRKASEWLDEFFDCANAAPVWSGDKLKCIPRSEVSAYGNGSVYIPPTAAGPVANLLERDYVGTEKLVTYERKAQVDRNNILQFEFVDRANDYNVTTASEPESSGIALFGPRKEAPVTRHEIMDPSIARKLLAIKVRRLTMIDPFTYKFTLKGWWAPLEAMDLVTITEPDMGIAALPVRLTSVAENENFALDCEAEPFIYGANAPDVTLAATTAAPNNASSSGTPANVNTPIFIEPSARLEASAPNGITGPQLWIVVSDSDPTYGGCIVMISTDGGASYNSLGEITGNATTGVTTADWPANADPDTTNDLPVDLTESVGTLASYSVTDEDAFTYPCYVAGAPGGTFGALFPYSLMSYALANLTAANKYTLKATGGGTNHLRRNILPLVLPGQDWDHPNGSRFAFLNPSGIGILKVALDPKWIGKTLHFKFLAVNSFLSGAQDISTATDYTYTPQGVVTGGNSTSNPPGQSPNPGWSNYTIQGGALTQPTSTSIAMAQATALFQGGAANYNARTFTITAPTIPTKYNVTIYDPGQTGDTGTGTTLTAYCETSSAKVGQPGYVYIGSIVALPGGSGTSTTPGGLPLAAGSSPLVIGFVMATGATGTNVGPELCAPRAGTVSKCKIVVKASDPAIDLTIKIKQNGTDVFSADPTVTHATAAGTVITSTSLTISPLPVSADDVFTIDITSGISTWQFTAQLET